MIKIYSFCFLFCFSNFVSGQTHVFQKTYGGSRQDYGFGLVATDDGGFAMVGHSNSYGSQDFNVLLTKLDASGNILWSRLYGGAGGEEGLKLVQTSDGGFAICGKTNSYGAGDFDALLIKTDGNGNLQWMKAYGGLAEEHLVNLRETRDHGFILSGSTLSYGQGNWDMLFIKTDSVGDTLWTKIIGGINSDQGTDAEETNDGGYIFLGRQASWGSGSSDVFIMKTNAAGDSTWSRALGGLSYEEGIKVKQTKDRGYIVTGASTSFTNTSYDVYLNKLDSVGNLTWSKLYAGIHNDATYDVLELEDGGYIVTGETESFGNNHARPAPPSKEVQSITLPVSVLGTDHSNVLVIRTDANGDTLWARAYGGDSLDEAYTIVQTADSGFATIAFSTTFSNDSIDYYLIKSDKNGYSGCDETPAPLTIFIPATVIMTIVPQITSGLNVTGAFNVPTMPVVTQHDICSAFTEIDETDASNHLFTLFPNPVRDKLNMIRQTLYNDIIIEIYNMFGEKVFVSTVKNTERELEINISNLAQGIYTCHFISGEEVAVKKFVKE